MRHQVVCNESGMAMLQVMFLFAAIAAFSYFFFDFSTQYKKESNRIIDRATYIDMGVAKTQTLSDPNTVTKAQDLKQSELYW